MSKQRSWILLLSRVAICSLFRVHCGLCWRLQKWRLESLVGNQILLGHTWSQGSLLLRPCGGIVDIYRTFGGEAGTVRVAGVSSTAACPPGHPLSVDVHVSHPHQLCLPKSFARPTLEGHHMQTTTVVLPHLHRSFTVNVCWTGPDDRPCQEFSAGWKEIARVGRFKLGNILRVTYLPHSDSYSIVKVAGALCSCLLYTPPSPRD